MLDESARTRDATGQETDASFQQIQPFSHDVFESLGASWRAALDCTFDSFADRATSELARALLNGLGYNAPQFSWSDDEEFADQSEWIRALSAYSDVYDEIRSSIDSFAEELFIDGSVAAFGRGAVAAAAVGGYENLAEQLFAPSFVAAIKTASLVIDGVEPAVSSLADPVDAERLWARWLSSFDPLFFLLDLHDRTNGHHSSFVRWVQLSKSRCLRLGDSGLDGPLRPFRSIAEATIGHSPNAPPPPVWAGVTS